MPAIEPASLISLSRLNVVPLPAHHDGKEDTGNHRLAKHQQNFAADFEGLLSPQEVHPALCLPKQVADVCSPVQFIV